MGINCSSISVGDWFQARMVKWDYEDLDITPPMRVTEISSDEVVLQLGSVKHYAFVDDLQPIPITAEVLEKNGFVADKYSNKIYQNSQKDFKVMYFFENKALYLNSNNFTINANIKHIHELQHFLRMIKVEIEL